MNATLVYQFLIGIISTSIPTSNSLNYGIVSIPYRNKFYTHNNPDGCTKPYRVSIPYRNNFYKNYYELHINLSQNLMNFESKRYKARKPT